MKKQGERHAKHDFTPIQVSGYRRCKRSALRISVELLAASISDPHYLRLLGYWSRISYGIHRCRLTASLIPEGVSNQSTVMTLWTKTAEQMGHLGVTTNNAEQSDLAV